MPLPGCVQSESTYYFSRYETTWNEAKLGCEEIGGVLLKLDDMAELMYITSSSVK